MYLWGTASGKKVKELTILALIFMLAAAPDGRHLGAVSDEDLV